MAEQYEPFESKYLAEQIEGLLDKINESYDKNDLLSKSEIENLILNYYNKTSVDDLLNNKQDNLSAGNNILLENNKITYIDNRIQNDITSRLKDGDLSTAILERNIEKYNYKLGDYFIGPSNYQYFLSDKDTFYGGYDSYAILDTPHLAITVLDPSASVKWNDSNSTTTGYKSSNYRTYIENTMLPNIKTDIATLTGEAWDSHMLKHSILISNNTASWEWLTDSYISALTSVQLHGSNICDMNFYHTGEGNKPLQVFQQYNYCELFKKTFWLRSIASASCPCFANGRGPASGDTGASHAFGAVGLILFY